MLSHVELCGVMWSHVELCLVIIIENSLIVEAGQLGHACDLIQAVNQEQQPTLGGDLGTGV